MKKLVVVMVCFGLATATACTPREEEGKSPTEQPRVPAESTQDTALSSAKKGKPAIGAPPGTAPFPESLRAELAEALSKSKDSPRTRHLRDDGTPRYTNRLLLEQSPYLRQHAHNPVNWYAWGAEAFARARELDRPVFLSIGYSTCHWCHVMEEESFEDEEIGRFLNEHFVAIKVDREERPDVDDTYMKVVTAMTGSGGWPTTVIMTPDKRPFFAATYIPPRGGQRGAQAGLIELLQLLSRDYSEEREQVVAEAEKVTAMLLAMTRRTAGESLPSTEVLLSSAGRLLKAQDREHGGIGHKRKFPRPAVTRLFLRVHRRTDDPRWLNATTRTLDAILEGGIRDHVGGGFHRYTVDRRWHVPHFEKMLYTNAQLVSVYVEAWQATGLDRYREVALDTLSYVEREMTADSGAFYSATDADSEGEEGRFFVWTPEEVAEALSPAEALLVTHYYGVTDSGDLDGRNVLRIDRPLKTVVAQIADSGVSGIPEDLTTAREMLASARQKLLEARETRPRPLLDNKIIAAWNGLMISAFAQAGLAFDRPDYISHAARAAEFVLSEMVKEQRLQRTWRNGRLSGAAYLQDYAAMTGALLDLYEATGELSWLQKAIELQDQADRLFLSDDGAYFLTGDDQEELLVREHPYRDGAIPGGNSLMVHNLLRLEELTTSERWGDKARGVLRFFSEELEKQGTSAPWMLAGLDFELDKAREVVLLATTGQPHPLLPVLRTTWLPNRVLIQTAPDLLDELATVVPIVEGKRLMDGKPTAYVCEAGRCELPTSDAETFEEQLNQVRPYDARP